MNRSDFDKKNILDQIKYVNDRLIHSFSFNRTCKDIGIPKSTLRDRFNKAGYIFSKETYQYVITSQKSNIASSGDKIKDISNSINNSLNNVSNITSKEIETKKVEEKSTNICLKDNITPTVNDKQIKNSDNYVINASIQKDVINMLKWYKDYKKKEDQINEVLTWVEDQKNKKDIIDIPEITIDPDWVTGKTNDVKTRSFTIYKKVEENFVKFAKKQPFNQQDLLSMALVEYMKKYDR